MVQSDSEVKEQTASLLQERDLFKKQFLRIQENYEDKIKELSILKELGNALRSTNFQDRNALLWDQLNIIKKYKAPEGLSLMLVNDDRQALELVASSVSDGPLSQPLFYPMEKGARGQALLGKRPVLVNDVLADASVEEDERGTGGSLLCVPVVHNEKAIGVLSLRHGNIDGFSQNDVRFFSLVADQITTTVILFRLYHQMLKEEKQRFVLTRFFSKAVTEKILGSGGSLRLGGERKTVTIVFADLKGFTSMSEHLGQEEVVELLNAYFKLMTPIIFQHQGTLDKLMGDGMLAFFGAPIYHEDDPVRAVHAAIEMVSALNAFNEKRLNQGLPPLEVSIGINSGEAVAGYIGSEDHLNYTVIGDAVNIAQRLQTLAGGNEILISRSVRDGILDGISALTGLKTLVPLPAQKVKGKEKTVEIYRVEMKTP